MTFTYIKNKIEPTQLEQNPSIREEIEIEFTLGKKKKIKVMERKGNNRTS